MAEIWKLLFENAAHDSIGSCISDTANEDVYVRYKQARDIAVNLVELHSRLIATNVKNDADMTFTAINTLPQKRKDTVIVKTYVPGGKFAIIDVKGNDVDYTIIKSRDLTLTNWAYSHSWKRQANLRASKVRTSRTFMHRNVQMQ